MSNYEIQQAREALDSIKDKLIVYLKDNYPNDDDDGMADDAFDYLERIVTKVIKRQKMEISWGAGASPAWHADIFSMLGSWIEAETSLSNAILEVLGE